MKPTLKPGIYPQIYRGAMQGSESAKLEEMSKQLDLYVSLGLPGVAMHGFTKEMTPAKFKQLADLCHSKGLLCLAAYGLDSDDPKGKGQRLAEVAKMPECAALILDMEGDWENEASDKAKAVLMGQELRKGAPDALILDQPWPLPTMHWSMFPWEETAAYVDIRCPQEYSNDWKAQLGTTRYKKMWPAFEASWAKLENDRLAPKGLVRPRFPTIQGYGWDGIFSDLVNCLTSNPMLLVWAEPFMNDDLIRGIRVMNELLKRGFSGPTAVKKFQASEGLKEDNVCGPMTLKELGF